MKLLPDLPSSSRYTVLAQPFWAICGGILMFYAPLYMKTMGLSEVRIGMINSAFLFFSFIFQFLSSTIVNRFGRKRTLFAADIISWSIPMVIWAIAQNYWFFLAAAIVNSVMRIASVAFNCLLSEDTPEDKRAKVFGLITVINTVPGLMMPVVGIFIDRFGFIITMRVIYLLSAVFMTTGFILRYRFAAETHAGLKLKEKSHGLSVGSGIKSYVAKVFYSYKDKKFVLVACIYVLTSFIFSMGFVQILFINSQLGFGAGTISFIPVITAIVTFIIFIYVNNRTSAVNAKKILSISLIISAAGCLLFIIIPQGSLVLLFIVIAVRQAGSYMVTTHRDAVFMNQAGEYEKSDKFSAVQIVTSLISIPAGYLTGLMYSVDSRLPFIIMAVLFMAAVIFARLLTECREEVAESFETILRG